MEVPCTSHRLTVFAQSPGVGTRMTLQLSRILSKRSLLGNMEGREGGEVSRHRCSAEEEGVFGQVCADVRADPQGRHARGERAPEPDLLDKAARVGEVQREDPD